jgi:threonine dehydrogenase-like Zn-dependent dehydrogenase
MRALTWHGKHDMRVDTVPDPEIINPRDSIIRITSTAICGSDLHAYDGMIPTFRRATCWATSSWAWSRRSGQGARAS